ncbi:MAG: methyltransferase FkbM [Bacteroidetes bacterium]|jgi:FkbM family methyltransferase|nr:methyltransferase FkbM [Bacteroidota bacterium]
MRAKKISILGLNPPDKTVEKIKRKEKLQPKDLKQLGYAFVTKLPLKELQVLAMYVNKGYVDIAQAQVLFTNVELFRDTIKTFRQKYKTAESLFNALKQKKEIPAFTRFAFGIVSSYHEKTVTLAMASEKFDMADAVHCCFEADEMNRRMKAFSTQSIPIKFYNKEDALALNDGGTEINFTTGFTIPVKKKSFKMTTANAYDLWQSVRDGGVAEKDTVKWLTSTFNKNSVLFDIGACTGFFSLYASFLSDTGRVCAFEPHPSNFAQLNKNIMINNRAKSIKAYPLALSDYCGLSNFYSSFLVAGKAENMLDAENENGSGFQHVSGIVAYTVDEFVKNDPGKNFPTHLKIDVDGNEMEILKGAEKTLASPELKHILIELRDSLLPDVKKILGRFGFMYSSGAEEKTGNGITVGNYVFIKK